MKLDSDIECFCYLKLWVTERIICDANKQFETAIKNKVENAYENLISTSADQFGISKKILQTVTQVDIDEGIAFADMLNSVSSREKGLSDVISSYFLQDRIPIDYQKAAQKINSIEKGRNRDTLLLQIINNSIGTEKIKERSNKDLHLSNIQTINDPLIKCHVIAKLLSSLDSNEEELTKELWERLLNSWGQVEEPWYRVELSFDLIPILAKNKLDFALKLYEKAHLLRDQTIFANQSIASMLFSLLTIMAKVSVNLNLQKETDKGVFEKIINLIKKVPSVYFRAYLFAQVAGARLLYGDITNYNDIVQKYLYNELVKFNKSNLAERILINILWVLFEYSQSDARDRVNNLPYTLRSQAWEIAALRLLSKTNIGEEFSPDDVNVIVDLQSANKVLDILEQMEIDLNIYSVILKFTQAISNKNSSLNESQRLDLLVKLREIVNKKLPDYKNITHDGYKILALGAIEQASRISAKKLRGTIHKQHNQIISNVENITNVADKVFVITYLSEIFNKIERDISQQLLEEAINLSVEIPNIEDRINRLNTIAEVSSTTHESNQAITAVQLARKFAEQLDGVHRDKVLASIVQTAHQVDPNLASDISEKIESMDAGVEAKTYIQARNLSKSPMKLMVQTDNFSPNVIRRAANNLNKDLISGKGVITSRDVIFRWLGSSTLYDFDISIEIIEWAINSLIKRSPSSLASEVASNIISQVIDNSLLLLELGKHISFLSEIPDEIKSGFQGLSINKEFFGIGERSKAVRWIKDWLVTNSNEYIKICDPYFDEKDLWILQLVPTNIEVKVITTAKNLGLKRENIDDDDIPGSRRAKI